MVSSGRGEGTGGLSCTSDVPQSCTNFPGREERGEGAHTDPHCCCLNQVQCSVQSEHQRGGDGGLR